MNLTKVLVLTGVSIAVWQGRKVAQRLTKEARKRRMAEYAEHLENVHRFKKKA